MCTVVVRWSAGQPVQVLALRDELVGRDFDDPDEWWPSQPGVVGGRDRTAGGSWCVTDVRTGTTSLVLNRPDRPVADAGAPSRGVLPLLAVEHGPGWPSAVELAGMASFNLVLIRPDAVTCWSYDGQQLLREELSAGTHMVTSGGAEDGKAARYLSGFASAGYPDAWAGLLRATEPAPDPAALVVRVERDDRVYATVFGQLFESAPGSLSLAWSREPWGESEWTSRTWAPTD
ncbi:MAG: NRDE family protein [Actinomycetota bacterium]|nr:NRDE family protein [Actinomycetota bacterium]